MNSQIQTTLLSLTLSALAATSAPSADTLVFEQGSGGYAGTHDTVICGCQPTTGAGGYDYFGWDLDTEGTSYPAYTLIKFDFVTGPGASQIPPGSTVTSAVIYYTCFNTGSSSTAYELTSNWSESTMTWSSFSHSWGAYAGVASGGSLFGTAEGTLDVTASMQKVISGGPNYGWVLIPSFDDGVEAWSSEASSSRPRLVVNYIPPITDCNGNGIDDAQDIYTGFSKDCNANQIPDECDIASFTSSDLDGNGIPDECEPDCNGNGIVDAYDLMTGFSPDCNGNLVPDECDIASGWSADTDGDGIPDECAAQPLKGTPSVLSVSGGGTQSFKLDAGPQPLINFYLLVGSETGTSPGISIGGLVLPLNYDDYLMYTVNHANTGPLQQTFGTLMPDGTASGNVAFNLPAGLGSAFVGKTLHHAFAVLDVLTVPGSPFVSFVSNPVPLTLLP